MNYKALIDAGVHFGHQKTRWCPLMKPYIWGYRSGIHLIDVSKTLQAMTKAGHFLETIAAEGKPILWVGTKPAAQKSIVEVAKKTNSPYISYHWLGGLLTNHTQIKKALVKMLHYEDILGKAEDFRYTKKELNSFKKIVEKSSRCLDGVRNLSWPVGAIVIIDVKREVTALKEAINVGVPIIGLVDTNSDPSNVDYVIPGNDDSPKSVSLILEYLAQFVEKGKAVAVENAKKIKVEQEKKAAAEKAKKEVKAADDHKKNESAKVKATDKKSTEKIENVEANKSNDTDAKSEAKAAPKKSMTSKPAAKKTTTNTAIKTKEVEK